MQMVDFMNINTIPEIIEDIKAGKMVIIMDDEDRENEGDLIMAATLAKTIRHLIVRISLFPLMQQKA